MKVGPQPETFKEANVGKKEPSVYYRGGRIYLTRTFERKLFFVMTLAAMLWGALTKIGLL